MNRDSRVIRWGLYLMLALVTTTALVISYGHIVALAEDNGETGFSARAGAITVDGLIITCSLVIWRAARDRSGTPVLAWLLLGVGIAATVAANISHGIAHGWTGAAVAGWPALVATGCFHLVVNELRHTRADTDRSQTKGDNITLGQSGSVPVWYPLPDLESAGQDPDGYALWEQMPTAFPALETSGPEVVPAVATGALETPNGGPLREPNFVDDSNEVPPEDDDDPDLGPVVATAREHFAEELSAGVVPSVRKIRKACRVGHPKAQQVHARLVQVAEQQPV